MEKQDDGSYTGVDFIAGHCPHCGQELHEEDFAFHDYDYICRVYTCPDCHKEVSPREEV